MKTSNPLKRNKYSKNRPSFFTSMIPGDGLKDVVSGVNAVCSISGTRYGIVNGAVTQLAVNQPPIEDDGLRGCPAFTQYFLNNQAPVTQSITLVSGSYCLWIEGSGSATFNGSTATAGNPKVFTLESGFTGNCTISGTVTKVMLSSGLFPAPFTPTAGTTVSVVSEAATATTGTSFDLDNVKLVKLNNGLRGSASTTQELFSINNPRFTDNATSTVSNGVLEVVATAPNGYSQYTFPVVSGKIYEVTSSHKLVSGGQFTSVTVFSNTYDQLVQHTNYGIDVTAKAVLRFVASNSADYIVRFSAQNTAGSTGQFHTTSIKEVQAQGHLDVAFKSNIDGTWNPGSLLRPSIITNNDDVVRGLYLTIEATGEINITLRDLGGNFSRVIIPSLTINQFIKISADWGTHSTGQKMRITVNGVKSTLVNFSGSFGTQDLRFFFGNTVHAGWIVKDSLKLMDRPQW